MSYQLIYSHQAHKDRKHLEVSNLHKEADKLLEILETDPLLDPPEYEKLHGDLRGAYSRRINQEHRLVYEINEDQKEVKILRMWGHYGHKAHSL